MRSAISLLFCLAVPTAAGAQAFGVAIGAPISQYHGKVSERSPYYFEIQVPEPNPEFESYMAIATPATGVCKVAGIGRTHINDEYGTQVKNVFDRLSAALAEKYGKGQRFDYLRTGATWNRPQEWVWSIYKKERTLEAFWAPQLGSSLPNSIDGVQLDVSSVNPTSGAYVNLAYEFSNFGECKKFLDMSDSSGL